MRQKLLYRIYDGAGRLLYLGITGDLGMRLAGHRSTSPWWSEAQSHQVETFDRWMDARLAEARAIRDEVPKYNQIGALRQRVTDDMADRIADGVWQPGHRLPAKRLLAEDYGCSIATITSAMDRLKWDGLIYGQQGVGVFVAGG